MTFTERENFIYGMGILRGFFIFLSQSRKDKDYTPYMSELSQRLETKLLLTNDLNDTAKILSELKEANNIVELLVDTMEEINQELWND